MWKYLGLGENFRPKLPSRNWSIFLTIVGSFSAAVIYDKREKNRVQRKWCKLVEHLAKEPLEPRTMPRKLAIFLEAPPSDGLRASQDHFKEYVKPILVASGLDWEFIQGREEGDIRSKLAERIRTSRTPSEERSEEDVVIGVRRNSGIKEFEGPRGDIVLGRHTWKEYVRGVHEGWLGPLKEPSKPEAEQPLDEAQNPEKTTEETIETLPGISIDSTPKDATEPPADKADKNKKPPQLPPFISTKDYELAAAPAELPAELDPSAPISFPHVLGFLSTHKRLYRFLNRRVIADSIGRDTAAIILSTYRPYHTATSSSFSDDPDHSSPDPESTPQVAEQQLALVNEEKEWHKSTRVRKDAEPERTWLNPVVLDSRIAARMRRAELTPEDEARANRIVVTEEEIEGWIKGGVRHLGRKGLAALGFAGEKKPTAVEGEGELE
jgi:import inner membrane translocase subunit TIM54